MEHTRKLILVPADSENVTIPDVIVHDPGEQIGGKENESPEMTSKATNTEKRPKSTPKSRLLARILLKLAKHGAYNDEGQLRDADGQFLDGTDVLSQVRIALRVQKPKTSSEIFIKLLKESGVTPDLLLNPTVRDQLQKYEQDGDWRNTSLPESPDSFTSAPESPMTVESAPTPILHQTTEPQQSTSSERGKKRTLEQDETEEIEEVHPKRFALDPNVLKDRGWRTIGEHGTRSKKRLLRGKKPRRVSKR